MWSTLLLHFTILSATSLAETVELTENGGEVPLGDDVTITVADNSEGSCTFVLQHPQLCCYTVPQGGDCEGVTQSSECNAGYKVESKSRNCVLTLPSFMATDAGTYEAEGRSIVLEAEAEAGTPWWHILFYILASLAVAVGLGCLYFHCIYKGHA